LVQNFQEVPIGTQKIILEKIQKTYKKTQNFMLISDLQTKSPKKYEKKVVSKIVS